MPALLYCVTNRMSKIVSLCITFFCYQYSYQILPRVFLDHDAPGWGLDNLGPLGIDYSDRLALGKIYYNQAR
jgi:hypothetical protein